MSRRAPLFVGLLALALGCGDDDRTLVMLEVNASPSFTQESFDLEIAVEGPDGPTVQRQRIDRDSLPACVAVRPAGGDATRRFTATARLYVGGDVVADTSVESGFVKDEIRSLPMMLELECLGESCGAGTSCGSGGCTAPATVEPADLPPLADDACQPAIPDGSDGGVTCVPSADGIEVCNDEDDDCDGTVDEGTDSMCDGAPNADGVCIDGRCEIACRPGFDTCDESVGNGCETPVDTLDDCGSCGNSCGELQQCTDLTCVGPQVSWTTPLEVTDTELDLEDSELRLAAHYDTPVSLPGVGALATSGGFDVVVARGSLTDGTFSDAWYVRASDDEYARSVVGVGDFTCLYGSSYSAGEEPSFDGRTMPPIADSVAGEPFFGCSDHFGGAWVSTQLTIAGASSEGERLLVSGSGAPPIFGDTPAPSDAAAGVALLDESTGDESWQDFFIGGGTDLIYGPRAVLGANRACAQVLASVATPAPIEVDGSGYSLPDPGSLVVCYGAGETPSVESVTSFSGTDSLYIRNIALLPDGRPVVGGFFSETMTVAGNAYSVAGAFENGFVVVLGLDGSVAWAQTFPGVDSVRTRVVDLATDGNRIFALTTGPAVPFDGGSRSSDLDREAVLAELSADDGTPVWAHLLRAADLSEPRLVAEDGSLAVWGTFRGRLTLGGIEQIPNMDINREFISLISP